MEQRHHQHCLREKFSHCSPCSQRPHHLATRPVKQHLWPLSVAAREKPVSWKPEHHPTGERFLCAGKTGAERKALVGGDGGGVRCAVSLGQAKLLVGCRAAHKHGAPHCAISHASSIMTGLHLRGDKATTAQPGSPPVAILSAQVHPCRGRLSCAGRHQVPVTVDSAQWPTINHPARFDSASATRTAAPGSLAPEPWLGLTRLDQAWSRLVQTGARVTHRPLVVSKTLNLSCLSRSFINSDSGTLPMLAAPAEETSLHKQKK